MYSRRSPVTNGTPQWGHRNVNVPMYSGFVGVIGPVARRVYVPPDSGAGMGVSDCRSSGGCNAGGLLGILEMRPLEGHSEDSHDQRGQEIGDVPQVRRRFLQRPANLFEIVNHVVSLPLVHPYALKKGGRQTSHSYRRSVSKDFPNQGIAT